MDARSRKCREATLVRADGVARSASPIGRSLKKSSAKSLGLKSFAELTTRLRRFGGLRFFINAAATPPFQGGECARIKHSGNSFTRQPWVSWSEDLSAAGATSANSFYLRRDVRK